MRSIIIIGLALIMQNAVFSQNLITIDSLLKIHQKDGFNGNVLYSRNDSIIFKGNYGFSNIEKPQLPLIDESIFDLASLSKQFTALCIVQLIEKGKLSYSTKIDSIWNALPYKDITIEHLLRHQSGLPDYMDLISKKKYWSKSTIPLNSDIIEILSKNTIPVEFYPGTKKVYSNTGYAVLASVIEKVSGMKFEEYLEENIFNPLEMTDSRVVRRIYKHDTDPKITTGYYRKGKRNKPNYLYDKRMKLYDGIVGDGMINSTILDLIKWKKALKNNSLISQDSKEKMFSGDSISKSTGFGFGIQISEKLGKYVLHTGSWQGYVNFLLYILDTDEFVVVLSNNQYEKEGQIATLLFKYGR